MAPDNHENPNKNRRLAVGVEEFAAGKKGVTRAIQEFKHRKERKVKDKAILIRNYNKVKKREGYSNVAKPKKRDYNDDEQQPNNNKTRLPLQNKQETTSRIHSSSLVPRQRSKHLKSNNDWTNKRNDKRKLETS